MMKYLKTTTHEDAKSWVLKGPKEFSLENKRPREGMTVVFYSLKSNVEERTLFSWAATNNAVQTNMRKTYQSRFQPMGKEIFPYLQGAATNTPELIGFYHKDLNYLAQTLSRHTQ